ncbi:hypothetical protein Csa_018324 [Cucumis sativus]|nr:hypothetical protein Csa_018324 [Cucumis sativus]
MLGDFKDIHDYELWFSTQSMFNSFMKQQNKSMKGSYAEIAKSKETPKISFFDTTKQSTCKYLVIENPDSSNSLDIVRLSQVMKDKGFGEGSFSSKFDYLLPSNSIPSTQRNPYELSERLFKHLHQRPISPKLQSIVGFWEFFPSTSG